MKSPSLESFYYKINRSVLLTQSYTEIENLAFIIKACRLKPKTLFFNNEKYSLKLYQEWFDEFGNILKIIKTKKIDIIYNDLSIIDNKIATDLYYGLSVDKIVKISKLMHLIIGKDEASDKVFIITFLGIDNYLRSYLFMDNEWTVVSPLILGINRLRNIIKRSDIKFFHELKYKKDNMIPCQVATEWISYIPVANNLIEIIKEKNDIDFSPLFNKKGV